MALITPPGRTNNIIYTRRAHYCQYLESRTTMMIIIISRCLLLHFSQLLSPALDNVELLFRPRCGRGTHNIRINIHRVQGTRFWLCEAKRAADESKFFALRRGSNFVRSRINAYTLLNQHESTRDFHTFVFDRVRHHPDFDVLTWSLTTISKVYTSADDHGPSGRVYILYNAHRTSYAGLRIKYSFEKTFILSATRCSFAVNYFLLV